jgi:hypothetical protein
LHQDLYGSHVFPLQVVVLLSDEPDFEGGQLVFTEQRRRMQSRVAVVARKPDTVWYSLSMERPRHGSRCVYRVEQRHGVSRILSGERMTLGIIFHDTL